MDTSAFTLDNPPEDGISSLKFSPTNASLLLSSSWDKTARLYNVEENKLLHTFDSRAAVLDVEFTEDGQFGLAGGLDRRLHGCVLVLVLPSF